MSKESVPQITPYLLYTDISRALAFLKDAFGFTQLEDAMEDPSGRMTHAAVRLGEGHVMLGDPGPGYKPPRELGNVTHYIYVMVDDVNKHFANAQSAGAEIVEEPKNTPYGHRRYIAMDQEGHHWSFAQEL